jgi:hypothetical protein
MAIGSDVQRAHDRLLGEVRLLECGRPVNGNARSESCSEHTPPLLSPPSFKKSMPKTTSASTPASTVLTCP